MKCSMTGIPIRDSSDGIWDDGEWISWEWIDSQRYAQEIQEEYPHASLQVIQVFEDLTQAAQTYHQCTGRYLQIWGELGELYAEIKFGLKRHQPGTQGSDGRLGNDWVEVKTISPEKSRTTASVKRAGNFNKLLIVRIDQDFSFQAKMIDRKLIKKGNGKGAKIKWDDHK